MNITTIIPRDDDHHKLIRHQECSVFIRFNEWQRVSLGRDLPKLTVNPSGAAICDAIRVCASLDE